MLLCTSAGNTWSIQTAVGLRRFGVAVALDLGISEVWWPFIGCRI